MTLQPGRALQVAAPLGVTWQRPEQQSVALLQVSPATRQPPTRRQPVAPSPMGPHWPPQQSPSVAQVSPATRQPGAGASHLPPMQSPEQQSLAVTHAAFSCTHRFPPQMPSLVQASPQHAAARLQARPSLAQPKSDAQASCPLPSCWHWYEQQSSGRSQAVPSAAHSAWLHNPSLQVPEQHASALAHAVPSPAHSTSVGVVASSTSRTHPVAAVAASRRMQARNHRSVINQRALGATDRIRRARGAATPRG